MEAVQQSGPRSCRLQGSLSNKNFSLSHSLKAPSQPCTLFSHIASCKFHPILGPFTMFYTPADCSSSASGEEWVKALLSFYKGLVSISYLSLVITSLYYVLNQAGDCSGSDCHFWQHQITTPFAQSSIAISVYWYDILNWTTGVECLIMYLQGCSLRIPGHLRMYILDVIRRLPSHCCQTQWLLHFVQLPSLELCAAVDAQQALAS